MKRTNLDKQIKQLKDDLLTLGSLVEAANISAATALMEDDQESASQVIKNDVLINTMRFVLEIGVIKVLSSQQPSPHELRILTSILDLCTELERIGDYAKGISNVQLRADGLEPKKLLKDLRYMARKACDMLHRAMLAFANADMETARSIIREDDLIDSFYEQIYYEAIDHVIEFPNDIERINYVLWVAHNLERVADRTTNVCERTIFIVTGRISELSLDQVENFDAEVR